MTDKDRIRQIFDSFRRDLSSFAVPEVLEIVRQNPPLLWTMTYNSLSILANIYICNTKRFLPIEDKIADLDEIDSIVRKYADDYNLTDDEEYEMRVNVFEHDDALMYHYIGWSIDLAFLKVLVELCPHRTEILDEHLKYLMTGIVKSYVHSSTSDRITKFIDYLARHTREGADVPFEFIRWDATRRYILNLSDRISPEVIAWCEDPRFYRELTGPSSPGNAELIKRYKEEHRKEIAQYFFEREQELTEQVYETLNERSTVANNLPLLIGSILPQQEQLYQKYSSF